MGEMDVLLAEAAGQVKGEEVLGELTRRMEGLLREKAELSERMKVLSEEKAELVKGMETQRKLNEQLAALVESYGLKTARVEYKDRLFKFIFGNPENKAWTLSLYNAMNGSDYRNPDDIVFNTIGDAVYMRMRNDVSFIIEFEMNLWEHQSTYNPNMPMRFLIYAARLYEKYIATSDYYPYSSSLQKVPRPVCVCFYNGTAEQPEEKVLRLTDAYEGDGDIEVRVTMRNVNFGKNQKLMEACEPLREYAWLVDRVRQRQADKMNLDAAVDAALEEMPEEFVIRRFLLANRAEVKNMFLTEFDEEKFKRQERAEGKAEGAMEKEAEVNECVATDLIKEGETSVSFISRISRLSEDTIRKIAKGMGAVVL